MATSNIRHQGRSPKPRSHNKSGLIGALQTGIGKWMSRITVNGKKEYLGYFYSAEDAHKAYVQAALKNGIKLPENTSPTNSQ